MRWGGGEEIPCFLPSLEAGEIAADFVTVPVYYLCRVQKYGVRPCCVSFEHCRFRPPETAACWLLISVRVQLDEYVYYEFKQKLETTFCMCENTLSLRILVWLLLCYDVRSVLFNVTVKHFHIFT